MRRDALFRELERQVHRIHQLLESTGATVTLDERIPDPDNPTQLRQIDVSIRRGSHLTIVECRAHKDRQDVQWIEELLGRRMSLRADSVIAVSISGFTDGARAKATSKGVVLRNFSSLTESEIKQWGERSQFTLVFYEFLDVRLTFELAGPASPRPVLTGQDGKPIMWRELFMQLVSRSGVDKAGEGYVGFEAKMPGIRVDGTFPLNVRFRGRLRCLKKEFALPTVKIYADPVEMDAKALVERFLLGETQVIKGPELASMVFDLSRIKYPPNCIFGFPVFHQPGGMRVRLAEIIGAEMALDSTVRVSCEFRWNAAA